MKFLALILSLYIFALNLAPCEDNAIDSETKTEISQAMDNDQHHQGNDLCSPFCICQCCHINTTYLNIADFIVSPSIISSEVNFHSNGLEKDFFPSILQPPQV